MPSSYSSFAAGFLTAIALGTGFAGTYMDSVAETFGWVQRAPRRPVAVAATAAPPAQPKPASTSGVAPRSLPPEELLERQVRDVGPLPVEPPRPVAEDNQTAQKKKEPEKTAEAPKPKPKKKVVRKRDRDRDRDRERERFDEPGRAYGYADSRNYRRYGSRGRDMFGGNDFADGGGFGGRNVFGGGFFGSPQDMNRWR